MEVISWAKKAEQLGAGELLVTSVDNEGLENGMDIELLKKIREKVSIPIIFSGGVGKMEHVLDAIPDSDAVAIASLFHYNKIEVSVLKKLLKDNKIKVRI